MAEKHLLHTGTKHPYIAKTLRLELWQWYQRLAIAVRSFATVSLWYAIGYLWLPNVTVKVVDSLKRRQNYRCAKNDVVYKLTTNEMEEQTRVEVVMMAITTKFHMYVRLAGFPSYNSSEVA